MKALWLVLLAGCTSSVPLDYTPQPGQEQAVAFVWAQLGAKTAVPPIGWRWGTNACDGGWYATGVLDTPDECVGGQYDFDSHDIALAIRGAMHQTSLTHELIHAWQFQDKGIEDKKHEITADWARLDPLNQMLANQGL